MKLIFKIEEHRKDIADIYQIRDNGDEYFIGSIQLQDRSSEVFAIFDPTSGQSARHHFGYA